MFGLKKEFQVLVRKNCVEVNAKKLKSIGVHIFDVREAEIRKDDDGSLIGSVIVLRCRSTNNVLKFIEKIFDTESMYEGYRTFC